MRRPARGRGFTLLELLLTLVLLVGGAVLYFTGRLGEGQPWRAVVVGLAFGGVVGNAAYAALHKAKRREEGVRNQVLLAVGALALGLWAVPTSHFALGAGCLGGWVVVSVGFNVTLRRLAGL
jgi:prepilin-type N-terminal cleavage/methylation domain-containing protein